MKHRVLIGVMAAVLLSACHRPVETVHAPSPHLVAIDSLMQSRPDSALEALMDYTPDSLHDGHYAQLLASELLYKNYYAQTNRLELLEAMAYFDSIGDPFLSARCHYMNGVGYYEMDSVVPACGEYLKALEIMEDHYKEEELVGYKAKFMALVYNRLGEMFSEQYLMEPSIACYESALVYCSIEPTSLQGISNILFQQGKQYNKAEETEKAVQCFERALEEISDFDSPLYRDIVANMALCDYQLGLGIEHSLGMLKEVMLQACDERELLTRCLTIGVIYYEEGVCDSAIHYFTPVFEKSDDLMTRILAAKSLRDLYQTMDNKDQADLFAQFIADNALESYENTAATSKIEEMYHGYVIRKEYDVQYRAAKKTDIRLSILVTCSLLVIMLLVLSLYLINKKRKRELEKKNEEDNYAHRVQQNALGGRLKQKNMELKKFKEMKQDVSPVKDSQGEVYGRYSDEPICQYIIKKCNDKRNIVKSTVDVSSYSDIVLNDRQKAQLKEAAVRHYGALFTKIKARYPKLKEKDYLYCYLCLLGLNNIQIAALLQKSISTIWDREKRLKRIFGKEENISMIINGFMND